MVVRNINKVYNTVKDLSLILICAFLILGWGMGRKKHIVLAATYMHIFSTIYKNIRAMHRKKKRLKEILQIVNGEDSVLRVQGRSLSSEVPWKKKKN